MHIMLMINDNYTIRHCKPVYDNMRYYDINIYHNNMI